MNIIIIPSWYPSATDQTVGVFVKEQHKAYSRLFPKDNVGIMLWGQNDDRVKLWAFKPIRNFINLLNGKPKPQDIRLSQNHVEYFRPVYTWTRKLLRGNTAAIVRNMLHGLQAFESQFGPVDIIHSHVGYPGGMIARELAAKKGVPFLITENMSPFPFGTFLNKGNLIRSIKSAYAASAVNIAVSENMKKVMSDYQIPNLAVIPNFVDENHFIPMLHPRVANDPIEFFFLGRMVPQKGLDIMIQSLVKLKTDRLVRFSLAGIGAELGAYKRLAKRLEVDHLIRWQGLLDRKEILKAYQQCDVFILPSRHEGLPVSIIEAMACGKPVIATRCGGSEELVSDKTGMIVEPENPTLLRVAIEKMAIDYKKYDAQKIREYFISNYSSNAICSRYRELYLKLIRDKVPKVKVNDTMGIN